jgi:hypothetical protein
MTTMVDMLAVLIVAAALLGMSPSNNQSDGKKAA